MMDYQVEIESLLARDISGSLSPEHGTEIRLLLESYAKFRSGEVTVADLLFDSKVVTDRTWELLNVGKWVDVPVTHRQVYAIASLIHIIALLHDNQENAIRKSLEVADLGILLGHPLGEICLTRVAEILSDHLPVVPAAGKRAEVKETQLKKMKLTNEIEVCSRPSLEFFYKNHFKKREPVKLTDCIHHWPAVKLWPDLNYIKEKAGYRTVPIEIGKHYADSSYRQKLMKISDFINEFFKENATDVGYLAQHQLFDQIPELRKDIVQPDYCVLSDNEEASETDINAWFGPKGTVSPLHFDPKHNLLCQVVGTKKIIMYPESDGRFLYPREGMLNNTSQVDVESPDLSTYPEFGRAVPRECLLNPGEMLYIPPKYWHHVRALDNSFSVSFWWD